MNDSLEINSSPNSAKRGTFQCSIRHIIHVSLFFTSFVTHRLLSQQTLIIERYVLTNTFVVSVKTQLHIRSSKNFIINTNLPILWPQKKVAICSMMEVFSLHESTNIFFSNIFLVFHNIFSLFLILIF